MWSVHNNGLLFSHEKAWSSETCYTEPHTCAQWNKADIEANHMILLIVNI